DDSTAYFTDQAVIGISDKDVVGAIDKDAFGLIECGAGRLSAVARIARGPISCDHGQIAEGVDFENATRERVGDVGISPGVEGDASGVADARIKSGQTVWAAPGNGADCILSDQRLRREQQNECQG